MSDHREMKARRYRDGQENAIRASRYVHIAIFAHRLIRGNSMRCAKAGDAALVKLPGISNMFTERLPVDFACVNM